jgi:hypothetical protein
MCKQTPLLCKQTPPPFGHIPLTGEELAVRFPPLIRGGVRRGLKHTANIKILIKKISSF